jgi:nucleoside-diphosphate-sugar epimerase
VSDPVLLLTGATGFVGRGLLDRLLALRPDRRVLALVRRPDRLAAQTTDPRVVALPGDLTRDDLGLDPSTRARLARSTTEIVHCAAVTHFGLPIEAARAVNVAGTRHVLALARRCRRLQKLAHVSTVYVAGKASGVIAEAPAPRPAEGFCNTYQQSKHEAEAEVLAAMPEVPAAIYRLSSIIGDARTGRVGQFNHVHSLMRLFPQNVLPVVPVHPRAPIDLIPTDWAIPALAHLIDAGFTPGRIAQVCAGRAASLTAPDLVDLTRRAYERHPLWRRRAPIRVPAFVSLDEFEEYVERHRGTADRLFAELLRVLGHFLPHLGIEQAFANDVAARGLAGSGLALPPIRDCYERVVGYCLDTAWGRTAGARDGSLVEGGRRGAMSPSGGTRVDAMASAPAALPSGR